MLSEDYGCPVTNRFGNLLDDDADPFDLISEVEKERKKKKKEKEEKRGKQKKAVQRESQRTRRVLIASEGPAPFRKQQGRPGPVTENRDGKQEEPRGMKRAAHGERRTPQGERRTPQGERRTPQGERRTPQGERRTPQGEQPQEFSVSHSYHADPDLRSRGGTRGRRGGGGHTRNPQNFDLKGKRVYDRHSGTGISPEEKRGGGGPWNWGSVEEAASELLEVTSDAHDQSEDLQIPADDDGLHRHDRASEGDDGELVVQVAVEMSLDEWKALQEMRRPKAEFNIRKAQDEIPSKAKVIHQSKHLETLKEDVDDMEGEGTFLRRPGNDITSLMGIYFPSRPSRGGRGKGAQGGPASRLERGKPPPQKDDLAPNPDDPEAFPALSAGR